MDMASKGASNQIFADSARRRVWNKYMDPQNSTVGVFKDPAAKATKKEPSVQETELGADFFG
jgi:hypothetical protein